MYSYSTFQLVAYSTKIPVFTQNAMSYNMPISENANLDFRIKVGTTTHAAAQSADVAEFAQPPASSSTTAPKRPAPRIKGQNKCCKDEGPEAEWEFEIKPLDDAEVHYLKRRFPISKLVYQRLD